MCLTVYVTGVLFDERILCYLSGNAMLYTIPTTHLPTGACQDGWVSGASWKTLATQALVLAEAFARVQWWRAQPGSPVVVSVASEVKGCVWNGNAW